MQYDAKGEVLPNKNDKPIKRLVLVKVRADGKFLVEFLRSILTTIVFHRNMLKLYRNVKDSFLDVANAVYTDIDYSENLTIGVKWEPQSFYWSKM